MPHLRSLLGTLTLLLTLTCSSLSTAQNVQSQPKLVAELDYGTFQGAYSSVYNISYWQRIPFAAPPTGSNRFRAPQPPIPLPDGAVYNSSQPFDMCPQRTVNGSEDCLYLGLYSRPWNPSLPLRPVVVVFYGGGFIEGSAYFALPPSAYPVLNVSASSDLVFIYPNYRVNAFGFLAGSEVASSPTSDSNAGLLDQRAAIQWANRYAAHFGGDPDDVSIWGQSAGGGSVLAQTIANQSFFPDGQPPPPRFRKALASSPYWPKTYTSTSPETQWIYDTMVNRTGCSSSSSSSAQDTLACLKSVPVQTIRDASLYVASSHTYNTSSYTWAPVIDSFLPNPLSEATTRTGQVNVVSAFGMYNTHEGENFIPSSSLLSTPTDFDTWLTGFLPTLRKCELDAVRRYYPPTGTTDTSTYNTTSVRAGLVYRDVVLACPAYWTASSTTTHDSNGGSSSWLGEYTISPAKHASDTYWWNQVNPAQKTDPLHYTGYTGAFASFFMTGDPNTQKLTPPDVVGVPALNTGKEFVINAAGFANTDIKQLKKRCDFWRKLAPRIPI
ncbi:carboxylesterase [Diplogelasinospora grovesii]|uniref:Carboxylic ester hydrolase n=1 Tax=Diplogelasinospora grovesii TaxID=303347 RepID=A0AAN6S571_9PEZI|nr:carboxylesterase [Diplogelasinospora grovesii]